MNRRVLLVLAAVVSMLGTVVASADPLPVPVYEPGVVEVVPGGECVKESIYDRQNTYGSACERLRIVFGPIWSKPGQNDVLIQPVTFEKPLYDGYIVRFKPDLTGVGGVPPVEDIHLHHGTWLNAGRRSYGSGPWIASGEEKTIAQWPNGFGLKVLSSDTWLFLHMVHNATPRTFPVWVTYDIDYVPAAWAEQIDPATAKPRIRNTKGIWLDVGGGQFHPETEEYFLNPIFNIQKGFGQTDPDTGLKACRWPDQNCARFNSAGNVSANQGKDVSDEVKGMDWTVRPGFGGTLVVMGGHVHTGGLRDEVELVCTAASSTYPDGSHRCTPGESRLIHVSDAVYWDYEDPSKAGGPPISWDFSMTGTTLDIGWAVNIQEGDILRLNGVYETDLASWYEQMGIVMTWVSPGEYFGVDVFDSDTVIDKGISDQAVIPANSGNQYFGRTFDMPGSDLPRCTPSATRLCVRGQVTHGHVTTSGNHADPCPPSGCAAIPGDDKEGPLVDRLDMGAFSFGLADFAVTQHAGIPRVRLGKPVTFANLDTADYMWHTVTRCAEPCTGTTTASYPIADGGNGDPNDEMDFDSSELGIGAAPSQKVEWVFTPTRLGTYTFWCRIHPSMRGAFEVVPADTPS